MDAQTQQPEEEFELNAVGKFAAQFLQYGSNASNNLANTFDNMTMKHWIRLIVIIGGYMLLRPYAMKLGGKVAVRKMEEEHERTKAQISPNELRGQGPDETEGADDEAVATGADWGQKARTRQREILKRMVEAEEQRKMDEEDDKDIEDLLED
ncbi:hypothetical protein G7046_g2028 [Stylonectria norvegica]|nr:hypothetical protein G7046_g2028 [Stylonectria norvegica]